MYRTLCTGHYVQDTMYRTPCAERYLLDLIVLLHCRYIYFVYSKYLSNSYVSKYLLVIISNLLL